ncbi:NAD-dependent epimerase/dehydratase family protein [Actinoalloteichus spitiensis]|uniref:NAD-dependent epimerase/dehydratase family protein n=1 Tax=Actinoalloteichus spitiensis TaxID=252394 RepID=UPI000375CE47|nr:NAD-dependent epimerase/dehydratase family protein [Actinoalloteichus spitiensis]
MRIVVVGGSGNVGTAVLGRLARDYPKAELVGVSRRTPPPAPPYQGVGWHEIDIGSEASTPRLVEALRGADCVVLLAWLIQPSHDELALHRTNVEGSRRVAEACVRAGVHHLVYLSSVGAYSPGPKRRAVAEDWPTGGVAASSYSRDKAAVEALLDELGRREPGLTITRFRPGLILQRRAAVEIAGYFIGPLVPRAVYRGVRRGKLPVLPMPSELTLQFVHSEDVAAAVSLAIGQRAAGAFNLAADPPMPPAELARLLHARHVPVPPWLVRAAARVSWELRLQPTSPGWVDLARWCPVLDTSRVRTELGWSPEHDARRTVLELVEGLEAGRDHPSPALRSGRGTVNST